MFEKNLSQFSSKGYQLCVHLNRLVCQQIFFHVKKKKLVLEVSRCKTAGLKMDPECQWPFEGVDVPRCEDPTAGTTAVEGEVLQVPDALSWLSYANRRSSTTVDRQRTGAHRKTPLADGNSPVV